MALIPEINVMVQVCSSVGFEEEAIGAGVFLYLGVLDSTGIVQENHDLTNVTLNIDDP